MKSFEIVTDGWLGTNVVVEPELGLYSVRDFMGEEGHILGIQLYFRDEDGERKPFRTLTTSFGEFIGLKDSAYIDTNNNPFAAQLLTMGFCQDTGFTKHSGFCIYPLWKFDEDFLKEIDVHGVYDTYEKKFNELMGIEQEPTEIDDDFRPLDETIAMAEEQKGENVAQSGVSKEVERD